MKPPPFEYHAPRSREEALALLAQGEGEAKPLAGGQSLVPSMNFRLARPTILVDLNGIDDLAGIRATANGGLQIGAMTRQRAVERSPLVAARAPLIAEAMPFIAHPQIRNRGTFGGSIAHADPAAELPALAVALDATLLAESTRGQRSLPAAEFVQGIFTTALEPDELLVRIDIPPLPERTGTAFAEVSRRHGDYALVGAAAVVTLDAAGRIAAARLVYFAIGDGPVIAAAAAALLGAVPTAAAFRAAAEAMQDEIDPPADIHATAAFRRHLARELAISTLARAAERAMSYELRATSRETYYP